MTDSNDDLGDKLERPIGAALNGYDPEKLKGKFVLSMDGVAKKLIDLQSDRATSRARYVAATDQFFEQMCGTIDEWTRQGTLRAMCHEMLAALLYVGQDKLTISVLKSCLQNANNLDALVRDIARKTQAMYSNLEWSALVPHTTYDRTENKIVEAACPFRVPETDAEFSQLADDWIANLCGGRSYIVPGQTATQYDLVNDWLACLPRINDTVPALYLRGQSGVGKSALVNGLSRLWTEGGPTPARSAFAHFNDMIARCPIVFGDEYFPPDDSGRPNTAEFRLMVERRKHAIRGKYVKEVMLVTCLRLIFAENGDNMFDFRGQEMTVDDVAAIASRILEIDCTESACEHSFVRRKMPKEVADVLADTDELAQHVAYLCEHREVVPGQRMICRSNGERFAARAVEEVGINAAFLEHVVGAVLAIAERWRADTKAGTKTISYARGVCVNKGCVGVNLRLLADWAAANEHHAIAGRGSVFSKPPTVERLQQASAGLRDTGELKPRTDDEDRRPKYFKLQLAPIERKAALLGLGDSLTKALAQVVQ